MKVVSRRQFVKSAALASAAGAGLFSPRLAAAAPARGPVCPLPDLGPWAARQHVPVWLPLPSPLPKEAQTVAAEGRLRWRAGGGESDASRLHPVQLLPATAGHPPRLAALLPPEAAHARCLRFALASTPAPCEMQARRDPVTGQYELSEQGRPVLRYNYAPVKPPPGLLAALAHGNRKYAVTRSDYLHPLYGLNGEELTLDWSPDHPHHRGIYWAWPEVDWHGKRGDLHALQHVFARPTGRCAVTSGPLFAQVDAENLWHWEDGPPIVRERAILRGWRATPEGRLVDLEFHFTALGEPVWLARRETHLYGGLNVRLSRVRDQRLVKHTDPPGQRPRRSWGEVSGTFADAPRPAGLVILPHAANPDYPGEWVDYPNLNWLQPAFPAAHTRYRLVPERPLALRYRLWIHSGPAASPAARAAQWSAANAPCSPLS